MRLPWQQAQYQLLQNLLAFKAVPGAILLLSPKGCGVEQFATLMMQSIACQSLPACLKCPSCLGLASGQYADLYHLKDDKHKISVDAVRIVNEKVRFSSAYGSKIFVLVDGVQDLSLAAANALLKTLEEPHADVVFILIATQINQVPATISSRCKIMRFNSPSLQQFHDYLSQQGVKQNDIPIYALLSSEHPLLAMEQLDANLASRFADYSQLLLQAGKHLLAPTSKLQTFTTDEVLSFSIVLLEYLVRKPTVPTWLLQVGEQLDFLSSAKCLDILSYLYKLQHTHTAQGIKLNKMVTFDDIMLRIFYQKVRGRFVS